MKFDVPAKVINKLFDNGYKEQIIDIIMACENIKNKEVSDIPISPTRMTDSNDKIILAPNVYEVYLRLVERISNPETSQEIPFFLLGNKKYINNETYIMIEKIECDFTKALSETSVTVDLDRFKKLIKSENYSIISIGHTHGNVKEEQKSSSLARMLPNELKEKYNIREIGLNISLADIWQHEAFIEIANKLSPSKEILQTIIMFNGEMIIINPDKISKANEIHTILLDGNLKTIPTALNDQNINIARN